MTASKPNYQYFPKAPAPNTITWRDGPQQMNFEGQLSAGGSTRFIASRHASSVVSPFKETSSSSASPGTPEDSAEAKEYMKIAYELSEQFDRPFVFRTTTRLAHSQGLVELCDRAEVEDKPYVKDIRKTVMMPGNGCSIQMNLIF